MLIAVLVMAIIFGFIGAVVASGKGRSGLGWFIICFLFGVIGILIICVLPSEKREATLFDHTNDTEWQMMKWKENQDRLKNPLRYEKRQNPEANEPTRQELSDELARQTKEAYEKVAQKDGIIKATKDEGGESISKQVQANINEERIERERNRIEKASANRWWAKMKSRNEI